MPRGKDRTGLMEGIRKDLGFGKDDSATALIDGYISDRLDYYFATGMTGKRLEKAVAASFNRTHVKLNGQLIDVSGTRRHATQALPVLTDAADALKEAKPQYAKEAITFVPMGRGSDRFMAVTKTGIPIPGTQRTWAEMERLHQQRRTARVQTEGERAARARAWKDEQLRRRAEESKGIPVRAGAY